MRTRPGGPSRQDPHALHLPLTELASLCLYIQALTPTGVDRSSVRKFVGIGMLAECARSWTIVGAILGLLWLISHHRGKIRASVVVLGRQC